MSFESLKDDLKNPEDGQNGLNSAYCLYEFGDFRLDAAKRLLLREGMVVSLTPKAFDVLLLLVTRHGQVVAKDELLRHVWPDTIVEENNLNVNVSLLRKTLGEKPNDHQFIVTVPGRGYQFVSEVRFIGGEEAIKPKGTNSTSSSDRDSLLANETEPHAVKVIVDERVRFDGKNDGDVLVSIVEGESSVFVQTPRSEKIDSKAAHKHSELDRWIWLTVAILTTSALIWVYRHRVASELTLPPIKVTPLTSFLGSENNLSFSPDGKFIAFCWGGENDDNIDVYIQQIGSSGPPRRLTTDPAKDIHPVWSPDGTQIAFSRVKSETDKATFIIPAEGGPERKIYSSPVKSIWGGQKHLDWSPDDKFIAGADKLSEDGPYQILLISLETLKPHPLTFPPDKSPGDLNPQFSPDGQSLSFTRMTGSNGLTQDIYIVPVVGGEPRRLTSDNRHIAGATWTEDGREIVFSSDRDGMLKLWRISASGGTPEPLPIGDSGASFPSIARKGNRLAFVKNIADSDIYRLRLDSSARSGGASTKFAPSTQVDRSPKFSPDGKRVAFESERSGQREIWVCNEDGSNPIRLTFLDTYSGSPRWSPDGQQIAFDSRGKGSSTADIYLISSQGGAPWRLTAEDEYDDIVPSWSKDGQWIYFTSKRSGEWQVWKVPAIGGNPVQVTKRGGYRSFVAPDGKSIYYAKSHLAPAPGIWRVPVEGGDEVPVLDSVAGYLGNWAVTSEGIYYIQPETKNSEAIEFFSFATRKITSVASLGNVKVAFAGFTVSPDDQWALYTLVEQESSDLMLVENFR